ncbi:hypothetical protein Mal15_31580 [Stieleria maiorica]|uniref:DUF1559 domain-containing protein n=1 Tax=Stieleria maiorica TaxID=2795974 RepID=A0A5B9MDE4_9BACT|nr:DUF1559 domain-containing protein [Stieleria maiorica]QEF99098.1 hypothetical protein Mal15_31580 [Stieleria maiorica]
MTIRDDQSIGLNRSKRRPLRIHRAFTLIELLVVISMMGVLVSLLSSGVQAAREQSRRISCANHLRQQSLALHQFHDQFGRLPFGNDRGAGRNQSWAAAVLGQLEQPEIAGLWDRKVAWNDATRNLQLSVTVLPVFRCPTSVNDFPGDTDYAGVMGSALASARSLVGLDINNGVLIGSSPQRRTAVTLTEIVDGTSQTLMIAEVVDRLSSEHGLWADGRSAISHDNGGINVDGSGEIFSLHPAGAQVAFADGSVHFMTESMDPSLIGALCSRNGREITPAIESHD